MTEETKQRLRQRFEQILATQDGPLKTINDLLTLRSHDVITAPGIAALNI